MQEPPLVVPIASLGEESGWSWRCRRPSRSLTVAAALCSALAMLACSSAPSAGEADAGAGAAPGSSDGGTAPTGSTDGGAPSGSTDGGAPSGSTDGSSAPAPPIRIRDASDQLIRGGRTYSFGLPCSGSCPDYTPADYTTSP